MAQGWSFVWDGISAFPEEFEAWQYGPVNEKVYESAMDNMDENCFAFKKLDRKKSKIININSQTKENFI